jgi:hypothetical protein
MRGWCSMFTGYSFDLMMENPHKNVGIVLMSQLVLSFLDCPIYRKCFYKLSHGSPLLTAEFAKAHTALGFYGHSRRRRGIINGVYLQGLLLHIDDLFPDSSKYKIYQKYQSRCWQSVISVSVLVVMFYIIIGCKAQLHFYMIVKNIT